MIRPHVEWAYRRDSQILKMWNAGRSHMEISTQVGVMPGTVVERLRRLRNRHCPMKQTEYTVTVHHDDRIKELFLAGLRSKEIAKELNLSTFPICHRIKFLRAMGELPKRQPQTPKETVKEIIALRMESMTYRKIAKKVGVTVGVVARAVATARINGAKLPPARSKETTNQPASGVLRMEKVLGIRMPPRKSPGGPLKRPRPLVPEPPNVHPVLFTAVTSTQCRWPLWDMNDVIKNCCGARAPLDVPYCAYHQEKATK